MSRVAEFERAFANYVGADHAIALCNGTATLHTAVVAADGHAIALCSQYLSPGVVAVPPLTMASTAIAVLHAGLTPRFVDVERDTWLMKWDRVSATTIPVDLYGLHGRYPWGWVIRDAAQTLKPHDRRDLFTSYSFQASKILPLGEGGMLVTNDATLAARARSFSSLGYPMAADSPVIDKRTLKHPDYARHHSLGYNYRMADIVASAGLRALEPVSAAGPFVPDLKIVDALKRGRRQAASCYREAIDGCSWITPQHVPDGWTHDYWCYAVALESADLWHPFADAIERHGGERPYAAWRLTYQEPAFRHLAEDGTCPVAEDLQPRLMQFQTNTLTAARRNAAAVDAAIYELNGVPA